MAYRVLWNTRYLWLFFQLFQARHRVGWTMVADNRALLPSAKVRWNTARRSDSLRRHTQARRRNGA